MSYRTRNILVAVLLLAVGVIFMSAYLRSQAERATRGQELVEVLVATERISAGTTAEELERGDLVELREVRADDVVPGAVKDASVLEERAASVALYPGDQVTARKFTDVSQLPVTSQVTGTERLVALPVGRFQAVDGSLRSGDRVDVWASRTVNNVTTTWVAGRDVLVAEGPEQPEGRVRNSKRDFPAITLKVSDVVAERLIWSFAHSDDSGLVMAARPAEGATQTRLPGTRVDHE